MTLLAVLFLGAALPSALAAEGWWMKEPIRLIQTNLRQTDASLDPKHLVDQLTDFRANTLLIGMGGIVAYYPTHVEFHYPSPYIPKGRDPFGEVLRQAHGKGIRVIGRFDLSKLEKAAFDAHPEWFFKRANGEPVIYNGLYSTCINGDYYRGHALKILAEALDRYDVDGLFFNMFGNQSTDYSGRFVGHCHCDSCKARYKQLYARELPAEPDDQYREFLARSAREVGAEIAKLIHAKRPQAGFFTYIQEYTDGIMSESNTAVNRPLPLWPYASSDNVNRARNSEPGKMAVNLCMSFVDFPWRFATVPPGEIRIRLWQNVAHGGALALNMHGTMDQQDRQALDAAKPIYHWLAENEPYYAGQENAARILLLRGAGRQNSYRGMFRLLTEEHLPFAVSDNLKWIGTRPFDLVIATDWTPKELESYVEGGGRLLIASSRPPEFPAGSIVAQKKAVQGYLRVRNPTMFPSLKLTRLLMLNGDFTELAPQGTPLLTLVPPSMFGPPEKVHIDQKDTLIPGMVAGNRGPGKIVWLPWDLGILYYLHSLPAHAGLARDLIDQLLPSGRQIRTDAHPLVEMALMKQSGRTLLHLINLSGHSDTAYFPPIPVGAFQVTVQGDYSKARTLRARAAITARNDSGHTSFFIPGLTDYEVVVLE